ncbi:MAG: creatinine amidohydrolase [Rhizobiaceae bacterium MnEN-MB40S]|nr:MAG: creatinine amidohydrolase [Rhizobiaceae bacterium MnEN-MB40S]
METPQPRWAENPTAPDDADRSGWIAVLPLGAFEQHGPHLPPETDAIIAEGIVEHVISVLPDDLPATFLPVEPVGYSIEHVDFGNTKTLSFDEAVHRWLGIAGDLHAAGVRKFVMLNAHGGNSPLMTIVATEARIRFAMLAVATSWTRFGLPPDTITADEKAFGVHAGEIETSVMLALRPDLVDMKRADDFPSLQAELERETRRLRAYGPHAFGWKMRDLNPKGATGNALAATAEKGQRLIDHSVDGFIDLLRDVHEFDLERLA